MNSAMLRKTALTLPLACVVLLAGCASIQSPAQQDAAAATAAEEVQIRRVSDGLYSAGQPAASQWAEIRDSGVTTIINLRPDAEMADRDEASEVASAGMTYHQLEVDGAEGITGENAARVQALIEQSPGPVLLHCSTGNRAGALLTLIAAHNGAPPEQALELGRRAGLASLEEQVQTLLAAPCDENDLSRAYACASNGP